MSFYFQKEKGKAMTLYELHNVVKDLSIGGWLSIVIVISMFVEIAPVKISPIQWLGNRINKSMFDKVESIEKKVDLHITEGYRNTILNFQDKLLSGKSLYTMEEWQKIIDTCTTYDKYCKDNEIPNEVVKLAIKFIKQEYQSALNTHSFLNLPITIEVELDEG